MSIQTELAWAAGFFDGEGCASISKSGNRAKHTQYLKLSVSQTDSDPVERFMAAVGIGTFNGPYVPRGPYSKKATWVWQATGRKAEAVYELLKPYLSRPKLEQIDATLFRASRHNSETREEV